MSNTLLIKRSSTPNAAPSTANLALGELAINTYDGRLYTKIDTGTASVYELTQNQPIQVLGNVTGNSVNAGNGTSNITLTLSSTGVSAGTYGGSTGPTSNIGVFTVDQYGRITSASNVAISTSGLSNGTSNIAIANSANISLSIAGTPNVAVFANTGVYITGVASVSGNITGSNINTGGLISATGNVTSGGIVSATGTITGGNLVTIGAASAGGNITGGNILTGGVVSATGNVTGNYFIGNGSQLTGVAASSVNASALVGNTLSSNVVFSSLTSVGTLSSLSVSGNVIGGNVNTGTVQPVSGTLTLSTLGNSNIQIQPGGTGNIVLNNTSINALKDPVQNQDAATKIYVDNLVTTAISYHEAVVAATQTTLATATGGTITYNNGASGVGATLTTTGAFNLIDTANVQTVGTRILVKNEANAAHNGIYTWSNATVIVRSSDADTYGPANANTFSINDYFFVSGGNVNIGTAWIVDSPTGVITFGTSNIAFAQFSSSQVYTANTAAGLILSGTTFNAKVDGVTTAFDGGGNISVKASANLTTPNIGAATGTSLSVTGNITGANVISTGLLTVTGNIASGNVNVAGNVSAAGNVNAANATITANVVSGNIITSGIVSATGNIIGGNLVTSATANVGTLVVNTFANILATTISVSNITGALRVAGGIGVTGNVYADGMYVLGDSVLTVNSTVDGGTY